MAKLEIDILSDAICPWCYIGKRRLGKVLKELGLEQSAIIHWYPFELNPQMPKDGLDRKVYRSRKFGSWEKSQALDQHVAEAGFAEGLTFAFDRIERTPNTALAHRLVGLGRREGVEDEIVDSLFYAYFSEGRDIGSIDVLRQIAVANGLDSDRTVAYLESEEGSREPREAETRLRVLGVQGVPFFIVNGQNTISGAQPSEAFASLICEVLENAGTAEPVATGTQCPVADGTC